MWEWSGLLEIYNSKEHKAKRAKGIWEKWETKQIVDLNPALSIIALNVNKQVKVRECHLGYKSRT